MDIANLQSFEDTYAVVERIKQINDQIQALAGMGDKLCGETGREVEVELHMIDRDKETDAEQARDDALFRSLLMADTDFKGLGEEYTEAIAMPLQDNALIRLVGFLLSELKTERAMLINQIQE